MYLVISWERWIEIMQNYDMHFQQNQKLVITIRAQDELSVPNFVRKPGD